MSRVVLAMSGGVDSSVAAHLLLEQGHEVIGVFMRHGHTIETACAVPQPVGLPVVSAPGRKQGCCSASDAADARRVADRLGLPFYALNFEQHFARIIDYFVDEYTHGRTPNPCVVCNNWLKFGTLAEYADSLDAEHIATGHYARLEACGDAGSPALRRGLDPGKDQSYVLFGIDRRLLSRLRFPVGDFSKDAIRARAGQLGLAVADKPDSQEICFVAGGQYAEFVRRHAQGDGGGEIVDTAGAVLGRHEGVEQFTIGQRRGLGVALGDRRYVVRIEADTRRVVIGERHELARDALEAQRANWLIDPPVEPFAAEVKIRYLTPPATATVVPLAADRFRVEFHEPQYGVAPGQAAVCYRGDRVLGGGWIA
ncbi:MAG: tRNA 2-thiouridine(34) synthase MnmA [Pirellulales bacterium]|nr:tRNA 2-thiouridine(34) synthase MnmA [Pirellulales bacterium]